MTTALTELMDFQRQTEALAQVAHSSLSLKSRHAAQWPIFAPAFMLLLCGLATCAGSTGGGRR